MSKKVAPIYFCSDCGAEHLKWEGRCRACGAWNTLVKAPTGAGSAVPDAAAKAHSWVKADAPRRWQEIDPSQHEVMKLPDAEFNRALDGGLVPGSLVLLAGEPGIGKSTLLLQLALIFGQETILYASGEESTRQIRLRAERLAGGNPNLYLSTETRVEELLEYAAQLDPVVMIVDSVQTLQSSALEAPAGSMAQVRECTAKLLRYAKETHTAILLVGHVTKDGGIAGPKVLEHMVDVVLEFEGDRQYGYRLLRSTKNRFGATPELGVYQMRGNGLAGVANPSALFLSKPGAIPEAGVAVAATLQGLRPLLVEVQALTSEAAFGTPQRTATGFDQRRLHLLIAVLEKKCGLQLGRHDVFVNLAGGLRVDDPGLDLAVCAAIASSLWDEALPRNCALAAELSLTGELRPAPRMEPRWAEAAQLGMHWVLSAPTPDAPELPQPLKPATAERLSLALHWLRYGPDAKAVS